MKFKKGDRVIYVSGKYGVGNNNPLWKSHGGIVGTICDLVNPLTVIVRWDNDTQNAYSESDLKAYSESDPKLAFSQTSSNPNLEFKWRKFHA